MASSGSRDMEALNIHQEIITEHVKPSSLISFLATHLQDRLCEIISVENTQGPTTAMRLMLEVLGDSNEDGLYPLFLHALKERGYEMVSRVLEGYTDVKNQSVYKRILHVMLPRLSEIRPSDIMPCLISLGCLFEEDTQNIRAACEQKGNYWGALLLLINITHKNEDWFPGLMWSLVLEEYGHFVKEIEPKFSDAEDHDHMVELCEKWCNQIPLYTENPDEELSVEFAYTESPSEVACNAPARRSEPDGGEVPGEGDEMLRGSGKMPNGSGEVARGSSGVTRGNGGMTRESSGVTRGNGGVTRGNYGVTRGSSGVTRGNGGMTRGNGGVARGNGGVTRGSSGVTRGNGEVARGIGGVARGRGGVPGGSVEVARGSAGVTRGRGGVTRGRGGVTRGNGEVPGGNGEVPIRGGEVPGNRRNDYRLNRQTLSAFSDVIIAVVKPSDVLPYMVTYLASSLIRIMAKQGKHGPPKAMEFMLKTMFDMDKPDVYNSLHRALSQADYPNICEILDNYSGVKNQEVFDRIIRLLFEEGQTDVVPDHLFPSLQNENRISDFDRNKVIEATKQHGNKVGTVTLLTRISQQPQDWLPSFLWALCEAGHRGIVKQISEPAHNAQSSHEMKQYVQDWYRNQKGTTFKRDY